MVPSARQAIACVLFIFIAAVCSQSQVTPAKTATISGKVTFKNKELAGIVVAARYANSSGFDQSRYRATTDQNGNYRIANVPPGTYGVGPIAPGLVQEKALFEKSVVIEEGDNIEDVNFSLVRGGVITGKISDADGRPMVEQQVFLRGEDERYVVGPSIASGVMTDDRGVYRAFGLRAGKYKVYVGQGDNRLPGSERLNQQTFYPSVIDPTKATVVEVTEGSEANDIDIMVGRPPTAFKVTGRIVDGETGKPVPNISYGIYVRFDEGSSESTSGEISNANGEFRFDGVMPGKYAVFIEAEPNSNIRAEPVPFEVVDHNVTGLLIKTIKASSVSGVVVVEGTEDPAAVAKIGNLWVYAMSAPVEDGIQRGSSGAVGPDGSFRVSGLSPGLVQFGFGTRGVNKPLVLVRVERDGILQEKGVNVKDGEQMTGVRLIIKTLTATIRGQVKVEGGELPANARMSIWLRPLEEQSRSSVRVMSNHSSPQIDSRGRFLIEGVAAGTYEINIALFESDRLDSERIFKQQITVADNSVSEVTVTIKLKP